MENDDDDVVEIFHIILEAQNIIMRRSIIPPWIMNSMQRGFILLRGSLIPMHQEICPPIVIIFPGNIVLVNICS